ncbi:SKP1-like protein 14 [Raphanus sativus]|uniref:SKP1-like protein n=1 Tax=Raphanus sativus TaxID=3726 RepID=A0A6J0L6T4_RAPSA|nr:SKP1-like protein 14 [Raphanus sativus]KAJ4877980.1 SKP1-like protein 14 [Raphanus sativus]
MSKPDNITLVSSDGESFEVEEAVAREFEIVAHMLEDGCTGSNIPIATVDGKILSKVITYCKKHVEVGNVEGNEDAKKALEEFDKKVVDEERETLFALILAANYLNVKGLIDIACQKVADSIKDKQPEEVREIFNIENDFTPEEEAEVRKENEWAFH